MVSLEQIRALEARVEKAVVLIDKLRRENAELEQRLIEASRSGEQVNAAYAELERKTADSARTASDSETRIAELGEKLKAAEVRAADAEERAGLAERKAQAAEAENGAYRERALAAEHRSAELEAKAEELSKEQARIEEGLDHALQKLDAFEDLVMGISAGNAAAPDEPALSGDEKVEVVERSPSTPESQGTPFPVSGAEHELDIF